MFFFSFPFLFIKIFIFKAKEEIKKIPAEAIQPAETLCVDPAQPLTLEQLYSQCEQLAESLARQDDEDLGGSTQCGGSTDEDDDDMSAGVLDVTAGSDAQVSVSCDSWRRVSRHHQTIQEESDESASSSSLIRPAGVPMSGRGGDYSPEYIEVQEPDEPVPTQDSCLQVTEEDIALSMTLLQDGRLAHPLSALSTDNLTVVSHFTGETHSQGTASDWEPIDGGLGGGIGSIFDPATGGLHSDFYRDQLEELAKFHQQMFHQADEHQDRAESGLLRPTPLSSIAASDVIGSFKDLPLLGSHHD